MGGGGSTTKRKRKLNSITGNINLSQISSKKSLRIPNRENVIHLPTTFCLKKHCFSLSSQMETIYGGMRPDREGNPRPSMLGRLCRWSSSRPVATFASYLDFHESLNLDCPEDEMGQVAGVYTFTPTAEMPDTIYYQVSFIAFFIFIALMALQQTFSR